MPPPKDHGAAIVRERQPRIIRKVHGGRIELLSQLRQGAGEEVLERRGQHAGQGGADEHVLLDEGAVGVADGAGAVGAADGAVEVAQQPVEERHPDGRRLHARQDRAVILPLWVAGAGRLQAERGDAAEEAEPAQGLAEDGAGQAGEEDGEGAG